jgi:peptidoglycan/LPS O-acetylase OafA/YrhL
MAIESIAQVSLLYPLCLGVVILFLAFSVAPLHRFQPQWDLSYGIYIWHFPILQLVYSRHLFISNPIWGAFVSVAFTFCIACLSWTLIERKMLRNRKPRHVVVVSKEAGPAAAVGLPVAPYSPHDRATELVPQYGSVAKWQPSILP